MYKGHIIYHRRNTDEYYKVDIQKDTFREFLTEYNTNFYNITLNKKNIIDEVKFNREKRVT